ncbi:MAG: response regulator [Thermoanaerobaculia bacterium]|jgi:two-component system sensor histidine kinase UhpB
MSEPLRVLVIEDSESDAALVVRQLEHAGHAPSWRRVDGEESLRDALGAERWDVVISDYRLPGFDAARALTIVRAVERDLPFIVVSGTIGDETAVALMKAGAQDYLRKENLTRLAPAVERELAEARMRLLQRQTERALRESNEHFRLALQGSSITVFNQDGELRYTWIHNPVPPFSGQASIGKTDAELHEAAAAATLTAIKSRVLESGVSAWEEVCLTIRGKESYHLLTVEPWRDDAGAIIGVACASVDITETKKNELRIREQLEELRRWQDVTLGREMRVLELKEEVNALLRNAGLPPRYQSPGKLDGSEER